MGEVEKTVQIEAEEADFFPNNGNMVRNGNL